MMTIFYIATGLLAVFLQVSLLDHTAWSFLTLPLMIVLIAYLRRGLQFSLILGLIIMWSWDLHAYTFGLRALVLFLTLTVINFLKIVLFSETSTIGIIALVAAGYVLDNGLLLVAHGFQFGWRYYHLNLDILFHLALSLTLAVIVTAIIFQLMERFYSLVKR